MDSRDEAVLTGRLGELVERAYKRLWRRKRARPLLMLHQRGLP